MFNYCVWAWPGFARVAAQFCPKPLVLYADLNPGFPAMVGMLANAGSLDQVGIPFYKIFGELGNKEIYGRLKAAILGISAFNRLKGLTYVHVGGRSLCIDTAVADPALWMEKFGVDVDHVDQMELVRRAEIELANPVEGEQGPRLPEKAREEDPLHRRRRQDEADGGARRRRPSRCTTA